jgi:hypothetical protein
MEAQLWTYGGEGLVGVRNVEVDGDFDGDSYGDKVHFAVGSNQCIIADMDRFRKETE